MRPIRRLAAGQSLQSARVARPAAGMRPSRAGGAGAAPQRAVIGVRPVGITIVGFVYILSLSLWFVDATLFSEDPALRARDMAGGPFDAVAPPGGDAPGLPRTGAGELPSWDALELLAGTYVFGVLEHVGLHPNMVFVIKAIFPVVAASTVVYYIAGRR